MLNISEFVDRAHHAYFKVKLGDQDHNWAPLKVCKSSVGLLRSRTKSRRHISFRNPYDKERTEKSFSAWSMLRAAKRVTDTCCYTQIWNLQIDKSLIVVIYMYHSSLSFHNSMMRKIKSIQKMFMDYDYVDFQGSFLEPSLTNQQN